MFFALSKIFWSLIQPLNALCVLGLFGLLIRRKWHDCGQRLMNIALALILIFGILPIGPILITYLERQYPTPKELPAKIGGVIVLGGAFEAYLTKTSGHIVANDQIDRALCFVEVAKKHPEAKLVFSGGAGDIANPNAMEGEDARQFFKLVGLDNREILYEEKSRNTYENALYSMKLVAPKNSKNWVVTTSAYHMPRTVGIFKQFDWNIIPYQCDPKTDGTYDQFRRIPNVTGNFHMLNLAVKEIIGGIVYYLTGKSAFILPPSSAKVKS